MMPLTTASVLGFVGLILLIPIIWFVIAILFCIWVYRDAESRGMSGALWLIIVLIAGIIGLIVYLVVRKPKTGSS
jgi:putative membrane protein